jgi:hypothetical protein
MFDPEIKEVKRVFIPAPQPKNEKEKQKVKEAPVNTLPDGRKFIGSGEDANFFS